MEAKKKAADIINKFKYPLLVLIFGVTLMLLPSRAKSENVPQAGGELQQVLAHAQGVGDTYVIISEHGVVVVCSGAENAAVRLDVINAVSAYTGFGSDKITVLKNID